MNAPQTIVIVILSLQALALGVLAAWRQRVKVTWAWAGSPIVMAALLYWGGFWN